MSLLLEHGRFRGGTRPVDPRALDFYTELDTNTTWLYVSVKLSTLELMAFAFAEEDPPTGEWVRFG